MILRSSPIRILLYAILLVLAGAVPAADTLPGAEPPDLSDHAVVLMFDDGWHCVFTDAYPLLKAHNMTIDLPLISEAVRDGKARYAGAAYGYLNRAEVQELIDSLGAEISSHTKTHPYLTRISDDSARSELVGSKQALEAMFHQKVKVLVYPYGDKNQRIRDLVRESGYSLARSIRPGRMDFDQRAYDLPATEVRNTTSTGYLESQVKTHQALILFFHRILPAPSAHTEWSTRQFAQFLDWLDETGVQVVTVEELYRIYRGELPERPILARRSWNNRIEWDLLKEIDADVSGVAERR